MDNLAKIRRVKTAVEGDLLKLPGVVGVGIGKKIVGGRKTDILAIRVYVHEKKAVAEKDRVPPQIQGIPTDVVERRFVLHPDQESEQ